MKRTLLSAAVALFATASFAATTLPVTIETSKGAKQYQLEIAATAGARETGLMNRDRIGDADGMMFLFPTPQPQAFWMKNTRIPLDILYVDTRGRVESIARGQPFSLTPIPSVGVARAVIELDAGRAARDGVAVGDKVEYVLPESISIH